MVQPYDTGYHSLLSCALTIIPDTDIPPCYDAKLSGIISIVKICPRQILELEREVLGLHIFYAMAYEKGMARSHSCHL